MTTDLLTEGRRVFSSAARKEHRMVCRVSWESGGQWGDSNGFWELHVWTERPLLREEDAREVCVGIKLIWDFGLFGVLSIEWKWLFALLGDVLVLYVEVNVEVL
jgi:hypothetical protein